MDNDRIQAIEAFRLANGFVGELVTGARVPEFVTKFPSTVNKSGRVKKLVYRMAHVYLIITLTKYLEWYERYQKILPNDERGACKELYKEINSMKLRDIRNKFVAHILDDRTKRPLTPEELDKMFNCFLDTVESSLKNSMSPDEWEGILKDNTDREGFTFWIEKRCVNVIKSARNAIKSRFDLKDEELFNNS